MSLRSRVLGSYRLLVRACRDLCQDDTAALNRAREKIKEEYWKNGSIDSEQEIEEMVSRAVEVEKFIRQSVVQVVPVKDDHYRLRITSDTVLSDNPIPPSNPPP